MAYPPSSYGDRPPLQGYRRSFTLPSRSLSIHEKAGLQKADADADVLYSHPSARIILFSPPTDALTTTSKETLPDADYPVDAVEILPWRSRTESLLSTGAIVIEKVRGSTWFLKSADQKVIHTIMRNSQCWCVDGESKFVLRIGKLRYYRIELPSDSDKDKEKVQELKDALPKVLRFERTPCPFKRAFHVDLPEDAITPRRKGTWKRKSVAQPATPNTDPLPLRRSKTTRAWSLQGEASSPMQVYGRRGSDYGFRASRDSSPSAHLDHDGHRPATPSSLASSEEPGETWRPEEQSDQSSVHDDGRSHHDDDKLSSLESDSRSQHSAEEPEGSLHLGDSTGFQPEPADASDIPILAQEVIVPQVVPPGDGTLQVVESESAKLEIAEPEVPEEQQQESTASESAQVPDSQNQMIEDAQLDDEDNNSPFDKTTLEVTRESCEIVTPTLPEAHVPEESKVETNDNDLMEVFGSSTPREDTVIAPLESEPTSQEEDAEHSIEPTADSPTSQAIEEDRLTRVSSTDSFFTTNSLTEESLATHADTIDLEKTPHVEQHDPFAMTGRQHKRDISELTVTASTVDSFLETAWARPSTSDSVEVPATPALVRSLTSDSSWPDVQTPASPPKDESEGLRRRIKLQRSLSPLPPSTTLFSPGSPTHAGHFTAAFLQKACTLALVKPMEAVVLLVHILARIAGGATVNDLLNGELFKRPEQHRRNSSFPDQASSSRDDTDDEDDFGVPFRGRARRENTQQASSVTKEDDTDSIFDLD